MYKFYTHKLGVLFWRALANFSNLNTTLLLFAGLLLASTAVNAQQITLKLNNASIESVFKEIRVQSGYDVFFDRNVVQKVRPINVNLIDVSLKEALISILKDQPLSYSIEAKTIVLRLKENQQIKSVQQNSELFKVVGRVTDTIGVPLSGATVKNLQRATEVQTDKEGKFTLSADASDEIVVSYIGFNSYSFRVKSAFVFQNISLRPAAASLEAVNVLSTGYQTIPKERATGSFVQIANALLNRSVTTNVLDRLNGVTSGILFNNNNARQFGQANIEIRGRSTLFSNPDPLIIVDNFPYDGNPNNINPNDIENITILKDAAAASVWGSRSGNGVIVITTKKGKLNSGPTVSFNVNTTIGKKPDLYYNPQLTSADYIGVQQFLFNKGAYNNAINDGYSALAPAVEIFLAKRNGSINSSDSLMKINLLKGYDSRDQILKYYYRPNVNQQYQASISGGSSNQKYFISGGYDKNLNNNVNSNYGRATINVSNTYYLLNSRLEIFTNVIYTKSKTKSGPTINATLFPYDQLADGNGTPLALANTLRLTYASSAGGGKLLNWLYKPLDELNNGYGNTLSDLNDYRINLSLTYRIFDGLKASILYNYEKGSTENNMFNELQSYYTRNLINTFSQINPVSGALISPVPNGGILIKNLSNITSNNGRLQLNYQKAFEKHTVVLLGGIEIKDYSTSNSSNGLYGYNPETATIQNSAVNFAANFPYYYGFNTAQIPTNTTLSGTLNRFFSYYFNGSYTYNEKYTASVSARRDESNLFGVATNQKGIPLWSAGVAWIINKEKFYDTEWLPNLKVRFTYGYTGNVNNTLSAYLTATAGLTSQTYNAPYTLIVNPPNPSLRWEKNRNFNAGIDFSFKGNRLNGSVDIWKKDGLDLIGNSPIAPQTGVSLYTGNSANTSTKGIDIQLNTVNLTGKFKWFTTILYNFNKSIVTDYKVSNGTNYNVVSANYNNPLQGFPYYSIFSFRYAGLTNKGEPQGYLNGEINTNYNGILNSTNRSELKFNGSATPTSFGSLRNTFVFKAIDLSFNIIYKLGYYYRRGSLNNDALYSTGGGNYQMADYADRWQKPGDEMTTNVPALVYPSSSSRTSLYSFSDKLIEKGDHIRFQDLRLGYTFPANQRLFFKNLNIFTYLNNVGIIWKANKSHIDPDYPTGVPAISTIAFGLKADL